MHTRREPPFRHCEGALATAAIQRLLTFLDGGHWIATAHAADPVASCGPARRKPRNYKSITYAMGSWRAFSFTKNCAVTLNPRHCEGAQATAAIQRLSLQRQMALDCFGRLGSLAMTNQ